jgi:transcriptional regulator with XRE-family HTH domain
MRCSHISQVTFITYRVKQSAYLTQRKKLLALLKNLRLDAGLTQAELASRLQRDQTFVSKYETGERRLDVLEFREVCRAIGMDVVTVIRRLNKELNGNVGN